MKTILKIALFIGVPIALLACLVDAFFYEPTALVVRKTTITSSKITEPITIVFATDLQTDNIGRYERRTLQKIKEQNADLILFGGDYVQTSRPEERQAVLLDWNQLFREIDLQAPLGIYAIQGNKDLQRWEAMFADTAIIPLEQTLTQSIGEIRVTFLSEKDSGTVLPVPDEEREDKFRVIVGHRPNFAMATLEAELLLAGHTHGGQVQIPLLGLPLVTGSASSIPRRWATGITQMANGATLIVSHGTGMTRGIAPRVRFYCRPDIWVIRLVPGEVSVDAVVETLAAEVRMRAL